MNHHSKLITTIKWGALLGAGLSLIKLISFYASKLDYPFGPVADLLMIAFFVFCLYMGIKEIRDKHQDGIIRFPKAFMLGIVMTLVAFVVMFFYLLIHFNFIEKDALKTKNEMAIQRAENLVKKDTITRAELTNYYKNVATILQSEAEHADIDTTLKLKSDSSLNLLLNAYQKQLVENTHEDEPGFYKLDSFEFNAESLLYNISRNLQGIDSTTAVIVAESHDDIHAMIPVWEKRLAQMNIPQVESIPVAAAADSLSVIIYGLLLDIFVALFLYRKEKNKCGAQVEITPGRDRNLEQDNEENSQNSEKD